MRIKRWLWIAILTTTVMACVLPSARQLSPTVSLPASPTSTAATTPTHTPTRAPTAAPTATLTPMPTKAPTATPTATPMSVVMLTIGAYIDGRSQLVIQGGAVHWHHLDCVAPGRHPDLGESEPTYLNGAAWYPTWPDSPDVENRDCGCDSSTYVGLASLAAREQTVGLNVDQAGGKVTIVQQPRAGNDYTLIVEFDDNYADGVNWYEVGIRYIAGGEPAGVPMADGQCPTPTSTVAALVTPTRGVVSLVTPLPMPAPLPGMPQPGATLTRPMNKDEMNMHYVPAGPFTMGSPEGVGEGNEHPQHVVNLGAFWIDETEVTPWHYQNCIGAGVCGVPPMDDYALGGKPVEVPWDVAQAYCHWVGGRLPTEAEWEKAARGSDGRTYPWGEEQPDCSRANYVSLEGPCSDGPVDAGAYPAGASPYGVLDMAGNVAEWVSDWYDPGYYAVSPEQNPQGPDAEACLFWSENSCEMSWSTKERPNWSRTAMAMRRHGGALS